MSNKDRAIDDWMKEDITRRLLAVWKTCPDLRLMQLICNVFRGDLYYHEDYEIIRGIEESYGARVSASGPSTED